MRTLQQDISTLAGRFLRFYISKPGGHGNRVSYGILLGTFGGDGHFLGDLGWPYPFVTGTYTYDEKSGTYLINYSDEYESRSGILEMLTDATRAINGPEYDYATGWVFPAECLGDSELMDTIMQYLRNSDNQPEQE